MRVLSEGKGAPLDPPTGRKIYDMAKATSFHLEPVKDGAAQHNRREKVLDYIRPELTHLNQVWEAPGFTTIQAAKEEAKRLYEDAHLKKQHAKATPIREGVVVIDDKTTMAELQDLARKMEAFYGVKCLQIAIHRDEGYKGAKEWKPNLHAHMVFRWTNGQGENPRLSRNEMSMLQDMVAKTLHMERGKKSSKKHLDALTYKVEAMKKELAELEALSSKKEAALAVFGLSTAHKEAKEYKGLYEAEKAQKEGVSKRLGHKVEVLEQQLTDEAELRHKAEDRIRELKDKCARLEKELNPDKKKQEEITHSRGRKI